MSGRLKTVDKSYKRIKHDHFVLYFLSKRTLVYHDPRKFGFIDIVQTKDLQKQKYILSLGVDALSPDLTAQMIFKKISKSKVPIKQILLNQKLIAGIGNIYASEILFDSKISPLTLGKDLEISLIMKLIKSIRKILMEAIKYGGSSIRNFKNTKGISGSFQNEFKVYGREKLKCYDDIRIADFGTRRRHSFLWQDWCIQAMTEGLGKRFIGTSNCLIAMNNAPDIPNNRWHAMTRLDENRAKTQLAQKAGVHVSSVSNMTIWGNHSATQYPDFYNAKICLLYTSPSPRDGLLSRMPSSA